MQYYVIGPDGNRYGPGDMQTLKQWVLENRVTPQTMIEDLATGQRLPASSIAGLFENAMFGQGPEMSQYHAPPTPGVNYNRIGYDNGTKEVNSSFIWTALGFVCCPVLCPAIGLYYGNQAAMKGNPSAQGARIFAIVVLCLQAVGLVIYGIMVVAVIASGGGSGF
jgi:hypothetical protein